MTCVLVVVGLVLFFLVAARGAVPAAAVVNFVVNVVGDGAVDFVVVVVFVVGIVVVFLICDVVVALSGVAFALIGPGLLLA